MSDKPAKEAARPDIRAEVSVLCSEVIDKAVSLRGALRQQESMRASLPSAAVSALDSRASELREILSGVSKALDIKETQSR